MSQQVDNSIALPEGTVSPAILTLNCLTLDQGQSQGQWQSQKLPAQVG